jgi:hypothetical protein
MSIAPHTRQKQIDPSSLLDRFLVPSTFAYQIRRAPVQDVNVCGVDIDVLEEVVVHKVMVAVFSNCSE